MLLKKLLLHKTDEIKKNRANLGNFHDENQFLLYVTTMSPNNGFRNFVPCAYFQTGHQTNRILTCNEYIHSLRRIHRNEPISIDELNSIAEDDFNYAENPDEHESISVGNLTITSAFSWNESNKMYSLYNRSELEGLEIEIHETKDDNDGIYETSTLTQTTISCNTESSAEKETTVVKAETCIICSEKPDDVTDAYNEHQRMKPAWILCPTCVEKPCLCFPSHMVKYISKEQDRGGDGENTLRPRCPMCRSEFTEILSHKGEIMNIYESTGCNIAWISTRQLQNHTQRTPCERCSQFAIFNPIPQPNDVERIFHSNYTGHRGQCRTNVHERRAERLQLK